MLTLSDSSMITESATVINGPRVEESRRSTPLGVSDEQAMAIPRLNNGSIRLTPSGLTATSKLHTGGVVEFTARSNGRFSAHP